VTLVAAHGNRSRPTDHFAEQVVQGCQDLATLGVVRTVHLLELGAVALRAVFGCHDDRDHLATVPEAVLVALLYGVTIQAVDAILAVLAGVPLLGQTRCLGPVAFNTLSAFRIAPVLADFTARTRGLNRRATGEQKQPGDDR